MPRAASFALAAAFCATLFAGCAGGAPSPGALPPPPPPLSEVRYAAPAPAMVWVPGAWHWDGTNYVWIPGRWESPPNP